MRTATFEPPSPALAPARDKLRRVLVHDLLDFLKIHKEERRNALRLLGEIKATEQR